MRTGKALAILLTAMVLAGCSTDTRPSATRPAIPPPPRPADIAEVTSITVWPPPGPRWFLTIRPDGSAVIQYGSSAGDDARLPAGTVDFKAAVNEVVRQQTDHPSPGFATAHTGLSLKGSNTTTLYPMKDDSYFRDLIESATDSWQHRGWRFDELRKKYPIFPATHPASRPAK